MAEEVKEVVVQEKEPLFGKKERKLISDPLDENNPITVQVLGICSALAVTTLVVPSVVLAIAVVFVCAFANLTISVLRNGIPKQVRMIVQLVVIATLVTIVELVLKAFSFSVYKELSVFIGLIITNCIIMGRLEAFAMANKPWRSFLDGIGNGLGYGLIIIAVAFFRELFGKGMIAGIPIIGPGTEDLSFLIDTNAITWLGWYENNGLMVLPAAAMFLIGIFIWIQRARKPSLVDIS